MENKTTYSRPPFETALQEWKKILAEVGHSTDCDWILDENLVFEKDASQPTGLRLGFQTRFTQRPEDLARSTYEFFSDFEARLAFYRAGTCRGKSICLLLCDPVFETRDVAEGFIRRDDWRISFHPGGNETLEEIIDENRWKNRIISGRPLADVDFCMPLAVLMELQVHGRVLGPGERFGVRILEAWRRWQRSSEH
jgi:hypothetical protein